MKKIINNPANFVEESIDGLIKSHPDIYALAKDNNRVITRANKTSKKTWKKLLKNLWKPHSFITPLKLSPTRPRMCGKGVICMGIILHAKLEAKRTPYTRAVFKTIFNFLSGQLLATR